MKQLSTF